MCMSLDISVFTQRCVYLYQIIENVFGCALVCVSDRNTAGHCLIRSCVDSPYRSVRLYFVTRTISRWLCIDMCVCVRETGVMVQRLNVTMWKNDFCRSACTDRSYLLFLTHCFAQGHISNTSGSILSTNTENIFRSNHYTVILYFEFEQKVANTYSTVAMWPQLNLDKVLSGCKHVIAMFKGLHTNIFITWSLFCVKSAW